MTRRVADHRLEIPADLAAVVMFVVVADIVVLADVGLAHIELRSVLGVPLVGLLLGLPLLIFLPGYAVISALYPARTESASATADGSILPIDRALLSFLVSLLLVSTVSVSVALTPLGLNLLPVLAVLSVVTLLATALAVRRRQHLPPGRRFAAGRPAELLAAAVNDRESRIGGWSGKLFLASVVLFAAVAVSPVVLPPAADEFSEASLLARADDGQLTASALPTDFERGVGRPVAIAIENHLGSETEYLVVVQLHRVAVGAAGESVVTEREELDRFAVTVSDGERTVVERPVTPTLAGTPLRLRYLVYVGGVPDEPSAGTANFALDLWITVG